MRVGVEIGIIQQCNLCHQGTYKVEQNQGLKLRFLLVDVGNCLEEFELETIAMERHLSQNDF